MSNGAVATKIKKKFLDLGDALSSIAGRISRAYEGEKRWKLILMILCTAVVFVLIYLLNLNTPLLADDYTYSYVYNENRPIQSLGDVFISQYNHYFLWGGRAVVHTLGQIFLLMGKPIFNVINTLAYLALVFLLYFHCNGYRKIRVSLLVGIHLFIWAFTPVFGECVLWLIGSANYLWGILLISAFLLPYRLYAERQKAPKHMGLKLAGMGLFGILAGWTNENTGAALLAMIVLFGVYYWMNGIKIPKWAVGGFFGALIGFAFMILAPGNYARATHFENDRTWIQNVIHSAIDYTKDLYSYLFLPLLLFLALFLILAYIGKKEKSKTLGISLIYFCGLLASVYSMVIAPAGIFAPRAWFGPVIFLCLAIGVLFAQVALNSKAFRSLVLVSFCTFIPLFAVYYQRAYQDINATQTKWEERIDAINQVKAAGGDTLTTPIIIPKTKYNPLYGLIDIRTDPAHWTNSNMAEYYGIGQVIGYYE